jgi:hypothetical protein
MTQFFTDEARAFISNLEMLDANSTTATGANSKVSPDYPPSTSIPTLTYAVAAFIGLLVLGGLIACIRRKSSNNKVTMEAPPQKEDKLKTTAHHNTGMHSTSQYVPTMQTSVQSISPPRNSSKVSPKSMPGYTNRINSNAIGPNGQSPLNPNSISSAPSPYVVPRLPTIHATDSMHLSLYTISDSIRASISTTRPSSEDLAEDAHGPVISAPYPSKAPTVPYRVQSALSSVVKEDEPSPPISNKVPSGPRNAPSANDSSNTGVTIPPVPSLPVLTLPSLTAKSATPRVPALPTSANPPSYRAYGPF